MGALDHMWRYPSPFLGEFSTSSRSVGVDPVGRRRASSVLVVIPAPHRMYVRRSSGSTTSARLRPLNGYHLPISGAGSRKTLYVAIMKSPWIGFRFCRDLIALMIASSSLDDDDEVAPPPLHRPRPRWNLPRLNDSLRRRRWTRTTITNVSPIPSRTQLTSGFGHIHIRSPSPPAYSTVIDGITNWSTRVHVIMAPSHLERCPTTFGDRILRSNLPRTSVDDVMKPRTRPAAGYQGCWDRPSPTTSLGLGRGWK